MIDIGVVVSIGIDIAALVLMVDRGGMAEMTHAHGRGEDGSVPINKFGTYT